MKLFEGVKATTLAEYAQQGGFQALKKSQEKSASELIEEISSSGLAGRGGAGFPAGKKWGFVARENAAEKFVVCNAAESEPGNYKDEYISVNNPFAVLEGILIACRAVGAKKAFVVHKRTHPEIGKALQAAIDELNAANVSDVSIEVKQGGGHYLMGEETSIINFLNGKPSIPFRRPPYPAQKGVNGMPTLVNNVETLATVPFIIKNGAKEFSSTGTQGSKGTVLLCAGGVAQKKVFEVAFGTTLQEMAGICGVDLNNCKAVLTNPSGGFVPKSLFSVPFSHEDYGKNGLSVGSGGIIFLPNNCCIVHEALLLAKFFGKWSCRQCVECSKGVGVDMVSHLEKLVNGGKESVDALLPLADATKGVICGLAPGAAQMIRSALRYFPQEFGEHAQGKCSSCGYLWSEGL